MMYTTCVDATVCHGQTIVLFVKLHCKVDVASLFTKHYSLYNSTLKTQTDGSALFHPGGVFYPLAQGCTT